MTQKLLIPCRGFSIGGATPPTYYATLECPDTILVGSGQTNTFKLYCDPSNTGASSSTVNVGIELPDGGGEVLFQGISPSTTAKTKTISFSDSLWNSSTSSNKLRFLVYAVSNSANTLVTKEVYANATQLMAPTFNLNITPSSNIIQGKTAVTVSIASLSTRYGASVSSRSISAQGQTSTENSLTITPNISGAVSVSATVKDSRGLSTTKTESFNVIMYSPPVVSSVEVIRIDSQGNPDDEGTSARVKVVWKKGELAGADTNTTCTLKYRAAGASTYTDCGTVKSGTPIILTGTFDTETDYEFVATAADNLSSVPGYGYLDRAFFTMDFKKGGDGMAIGQACTEPGLTINMPTTFNESLAFDDTGANGGWIYAKTQFDKVPIHFNVPHKVDGSRFDPLIAGKDVNGNYWAFGQGAGQEICFVGFRAGRTENGIDWKVSINTYTGEISAPGLSLAAYPVGAVYISYTSTSPASLFGGSWTPIVGRFPYFNNGNGVGGSHTHTLTASEMPSHNHGLSNSKDGTGVGFWRTDAGSGSKWSLLTRTYSGCDYALTVGSMGGGGAHNNMPAYQTLYAWRRTA